MPRCLYFGLQLALPLLLMAGLSGCAFFSAPPQYRGNNVTSGELKQLTPGVSTTSDARALLGSPTLHEAFNSDNWVYVSQVTKERIAETQGVSRQHVVVLHFNHKGVLEGIKQYDRGNAVFVAMAGGMTKAPGGSPSILQQIIGGVGAYNPGIFGGQNGGMGGLGGY